MHPLKALVIFLILSCFFSSCAVSYKPINPNTLVYSTSTDSGRFSYKYDVLILSRDRKLAKKEINTGIKIVAVKITNNTGQTLKYGDNYSIYSGDKPADLLTIPEITKSIKETVPTYLLYLLLTPTTLTATTSTSQSTIPIGLILGPALTGINIGMAASANKHFRMELENYNLFNQEIKSGETAYGLIGIQSQDIEPLYLKINKN